MPSALVFVILGKCTFRGLAICRAYWFGAHTCLEWVSVRSGSIAWLLKVLLAAFSTLHSLGSSAIHLPNGKSIGWTVLQTQEEKQSYTHTVQTYRETDREEEIPSVVYWKFINIERVTCPNCTKFDTACPWVPWCKVYLMNGSWDMKRTYIQSYVQIPCFIVR